MAYENLRDQLDSTREEARPTQGDDKKNTKGSIGEAQSRNAMMSDLTSKGKEPTDLLKSEPLDTLDTNFDASSLETGKNSNAQGVDAAIATNDGQIYAVENKDRAKVSSSTFGLDKEVGKQALAMGVPAGTTKGDDYLAQAHKKVATTDLPEPALAYTSRAPQNSEPFYEFNEEAISFDKDVRATSPYTSSGSVWGNDAIEVAAELEARKAAKMDIPVASTTDQPVSAKEASKLAFQGVESVHYVDTPQNEMSSETSLSSLTSNNEDYSVGEVSNSYGDTSDSDSVGSV